MKLSKKLIYIIAGTTVVSTAAVGAGIGIWHNKSKKIDLSTVIKELNLGEIDKSDKIHDVLLNLIKEKNPDLDLDKIELDNIQQDKVTVRPKVGDNTYKGHVDIVFSIIDQEEKIINKIKHIWDYEFKDRFIDVKEVLPNLANEETISEELKLTNDILLKSVIRRLKMHNVSISIFKGDENLDNETWSKYIITHKDKIFKIKYKDQIIELPFGKFNDFQTKFKDNSFEEVTEIGYVVSPRNGLFTAF
ncbi:hypothetical protein NX779_04320 [Mycoplasma cottewii]|uniref:Lipoprotein n=1 Tax=Mycoplasma cottewii TaxID=51364 RepID=A0ABY5TWG9_9MOLU|nr:hypothetical protein [Mycoplasma cottewii]UWD34997.1 hypothetical protein NX779_04320 [Mycoplasma cottewii]